MFKRAAYIAVIAIAIVASLSLPAWCAYDMFLKIDGIPGETRAQPFKITLDFSSPTQQDFSFLDKAGAICQSVSGASGMQINRQTHSIILLMPSSFSWGTIRPLIDKIKGQLQDRLNMNIVNVQFPDNEQANKYIKLEKHVDIEYKE